MKPLVSIITPTTISREVFNEKLRDIVDLQDYPNIEHLFDYEDGTVGEKRNRLCEAAKGDIILHMDSDDWYAHDWVSRSVEALMKSGKQLTGLSTFNFHNPTTGGRYQYSYPKKENLAGATLCYYKSLWEQHKFQPLQIGEDITFVRGTNYYPHEYVAGFTATIHEGNTCRKNISGDNWREL
jgi:hypothetical protein